MTLHHDFHHKAYVDNLNAAIKDMPTLSGKTLEQLLATRIHVAASGTKQRRRPLESQRVLEDDGSGWQGRKTIGSAGSTN